MARTSAPGDSSGSVSNSCSTAASAGRFLSPDPSLSRPLSNAAACHSSPEGSPPHFAPLLLLGAPCSVVPRFKAELHLQVTIKVAAENTTMGLWEGCYGCISLW
ncbi:hypothetical protein EJB05_46826 [Eragrostis curvula]|uniref:Uncharacterized protein n=1 Tax=Eragrostis curvula TaxID=38414 RepID=A0A5J9T629_9POAL|nr:hypothetical protein EJB05_46826 [Eragrostis curvula]